MMTIVKQWGPTLQYSMLVLEHQTLCLLWGKKQALELGSPGNRSSSVPPAYINKLTVQGMCDIRPFNLPYSRVKGMGFRERKRVSVNKVNSNIYHILLKNITPLK
jgi:hypothetical protein